MSRSSSSSGRTALVSESPSSPNILDSDSSSLDRSHGESDTFTMPNRPIDLLNEDSPYTYDGENSNSSVVTIAQPLEDEDSSSAQPPSSLPSNDGNSSAIQSMNEDSNTSLPEAQIRKSVPHSDEPPAKVRKLSPVKSEEGDGESCPICLESWGNSGEHRLVSLKCGHLFGSRCVERWLRSHTVRERSCPTCKSKASIKDIRFIYARKLVAADTSEITALQKQVELLQSEKSKTELELQKMNIAHRACMMQLENLRNSLVKNQVVTNKLRKTWRFALEKILEICKDNCCRVLAYNCRSYELYVSQKSSNNLFPGYGVRKVNCIDHKLGQFIHLHPKPVRDITYSQPKDLLLSVSLDNSAKVVERGIPTIAFQVGVPLWSCSWDCIRSNEFYVGGVGGVVHQYDIRNPGTYIQRLQSPGDVSPVVSLCSTDYGLLSCHLNSSWLWVANSRGAWEPRPLPVDGPFMSLAYDAGSNRALITGRPGANRSERSKLSLCRLTAIVPSGEVTCEVEQTFNGGSWSSLMSRSCIVNESEASWAAVYSESDSAISLHGLDDTKSLSVPAVEPALDLLSIQINGDTLLAALSQSRLRLYKAVSTNS